MADGRGINVLVLGGGENPPESLLKELKEFGTAELRSIADHPRGESSVEAAADRFDLAMVDAASDAFASKSGQATIQKLALRLPVLVWVDDDDRDLALSFLRLGAQEVLVHGKTKRAALHRVIACAVERFRFSRTAKYPRSERRRDDRRQLNRRQSGRIVGNGHDASTTLDRLPMGVLLTDAEQRVLMMNTKARAIIQRGLGLRIDADGKCRAATPHDDKALTGLIREMSGGDGGEFGGALSVSGANDEPPLSILVTPAGGDPSHKGAALFFSATGDPPPVSEIALQRLYDLTEAEASLVLGLVGGQTLNDLATQREVSPHTVRTQLKQIFFKTSVKRQSELVKLVLTGPAVLAPPPADNGTV